MAESRGGNGNGNGGDAAADVGRAASLLEAKDHEAAASLAEGVLDRERAVLAQAALIKGKALLSPLLSQIMDSAAEEDYPDKEAFKGPWTNFMLALSLEPENEEAKAELAKLNRLADSFTSSDLSSPLPEVVVQRDYQDSPAQTTASATTTTSTSTSGGGRSDASFPHDVIVVGAGASGVGLGVMLTKTFGLESDRVLLVERGESFS